jgi:predicted 3-demethylubiquinone-9 3-methyltransferase (glyoxalase superfamily)
MGKKKAVRLKPKGSAATRITPFLWFDNQAEEAATFYTEIFSSIWGPKDTAITKAYAG